MNTLQTLLAVVLIFALTDQLQAQKSDSLILNDPVSLTVQKRNLGGKKQNVFVLVVAHANIAEVEKAWDKYMEEGNKAKMEVDGNIRTILGITNKYIDPNQTIDIFSELAQGREGVYVYAAFRLSDSTWIKTSGNDDKTIRTEKMLIKFGRKIYKEKLLDELKEEENKLDDLEKDYNSNLKKQTSLQKEIQADSLEIFNIENDIKAAKDNYTELTETLSRKQREMRSTEFTSAEAKKMAEKELKEMEKEKKRMAKSIEKMQGRLIDQNNNIVEADYYLQMAKEEEQKILDKISEQKKVIDHLKNAIEKYEN